MWALQPSWRSGLYVSASDNAAQPGSLRRLRHADPFGWLGAAVVSGLLSWAVGALTIRLRADYLAIATFGVAVTIQLCVLNLQPLTGGAFGIGFIPRPFAAWQENALAFSLGNLAIMVLVVLALYLGLQHLAKSPWGRVLRAIREDEVAAQALGKRPIRFRLQAFTLGGAIMGLAGATQAHFIGFIAPDNYMPILTFQVWAMLIVGGSGNNRGAIAGAILVWGLWALSAAAVSSFIPAEQQARAAALQIVAIGVGLCLMLCGAHAACLARSAADTPEIPARYSIQGIIFMQARPERTLLAPGLEISRLVCGLWQVADIEKDGSNHRPGTGCRCAAGLCAGWL